MSSDDDMDSGSESEYSYHSQSEDDDDYGPSGHGGGEGKCSGATSNGEPYTILSKRDLNQHKSEVRPDPSLFCLFPVPFPHPPRFVSPDTLMILLL